MAKERANTPEITHDASYQNREWKIQRIGWVVMVVIALAAFTGVFGRGPVASTRARAPGGEFELEYERVLRNRVRTHLVVRLPASSGEVGIWLDRRLLDNHELLQIVPQPERTISSSDRATYYFQVEPGAAIDFVLVPRKMGARRWRVGSSSSRNTLEVSCFVLP